MGSADSRSLPIHLIVIFLLLSLFIGIAGNIYHQKNKELLKKEKQQELSTIADLEVKQIAAWRKERLGDGAVILNSDFIADNTQQFLKKPGDSRQRQMLLKWMNSMLTHYDYQSILFIDTQESIQLTVPEGKQVLGPDAKRLVAEALRTKEVLLSDLYRSKTADVIRHSLVVPVLINKGQNAVAIGAFLFRIDPYKSLYPLIQTWPTPSKTAEAVLVRQEGNDIIYLNELRHWKGESLSLRLPKNTPNLIAAKAVSGYQGVVEGLDYRGGNVLAVTRVIPDSTWFLICKIDQAEIFSVSYRQGWIVTLFSSLLVLVSGLAVIAIWRHQRVEFFRRQSEERRKSEEILLQEKLFSNSVISSLPGVFYLFDKTGRLLRWNRNLETVTGFSAEEIAKMHPVDFFSSSEKELVGSRIQEVFVKGASSVEANLVTKDVRQIPHFFTGVLTKAGGQDCLIGMGIDITDMKKAEAELKASELKYRTLLENLPQKIFLKDSNSIYVSCNQNFAAELGITPGEFAGKTDYDFFPKELAEKYRADDRRIIESGKTEDIEEQYLQGEHEYTVHTVKTPILDEEDNITGILGIFWDITDLKKMEAELEQYRRHLEDLVAERTAELSATNKELESFSYTISHDLRAPLRAIDGFSGILLEEYQDRIDSEGKRFLKIIRRNTQNMGQLIDDLLAFSRTGRQEVVKSRISLEKLARSVAEEIKTSIAGRKVHIDIGNLPDAYGDHSMLRQVFINLISNSVKFTRLRETANIEINSMTQGDEIVYFIKDNGAGFDMKYTDKLFGVFQRLHRADEFEGTGVGLAIVQRVIHRHGGRVWAESTPGEGTTFYFTLPVKDREDRR